MNKRLLLATSAALAIATSAFAQSSTSPSSSTTTPHQQDSHSTTTPSSSSQSTSPSSNSTAQTQAPASTSQSATGQSTNSSASTQSPATGNTTSQAQTSSPSNQTSTNSQSGQTNPPSNQAQTNPSANSQTQTANPPSTNNNQAQKSQPSGSSTNTAQQPNHNQNTAERSSTSVNASVNINDQQRTRINQSVAHLNVHPLTSVNFSLSVGTAVPRDVHLEHLPADVVEVVPQYRGYDFVLVKDEIVIVEPSSYKIVAVLPYSGRSTAAAPAQKEQRKTTFSDRDREVIRKHARSHSAERRTTTGSTVRTEIRMGEPVPEGVEIEAFPDEVYRDAPDLREYRYINRDSRTYVVEPRERRIIEEID